MATFIRLRHYIYQERYFAQYEDEGNNQSYMFPCNKAGEICTCGLSKANMDTLAMCQQGTYKKQVLDFSSRYYEPAVLQCNVCCQPVCLEDAWANECGSCGTEYNAFGQQLAPRSQWEDEY